MLKALFILIVLLILVGSSAGLYFLWRPVECDWQDRGCNYSQACMNQVCMDEGGNVMRVQCLPVERCKEAPVCEKWQDIGFIKRNPSTEDNLDNQIREAAFSLPHPQNNQPGLSSLTLPGGDV